MEPLEAPRGQQMLPARWDLSKLFGEIANRTSRAAGRALTFMIAAGIILIWGVTGPICQYSDTWQLVINTGTSVITFPMVFIIQNSQNRDSAAEHLADDELQEIRTGCERRAKAEKCRRFRRTNGEEGQEGRRSRHRLESSKLCAPHRIAQHRRLGKRSAALAIKSLRKLTFV